MRLALAVVLLAGVARAEDLTLEQALRLATVSSPRAQAARARVGVAAAEQVAVAVFPNPTFSYGAQQLAAGESTGAVTQHQFQLQQPLPLFGTWGARRTWAERGVDAEKAQEAQGASDRRLLVRQSFAALLARQERRRVLDEAAADLARVRAVVQGRAALGESSRYDLARIDLEAGTLSVERLNAATEEADAAGSMAEAVGLSSPTVRAVGNLAPSDLPADPEALWTAAEMRRPALRAARTRQQLAQASLDVAHRDGWPVPTISSGLALTQAVNGVSAMWGVAIPLPAFDRNQGAAARAEAQIELEDRVYAAELAEARAEVQRAAAVLASRRATLDTFSRDVARALPGLRQMADDAYRGGKGGILELLDAFRALKEARMLEVQQQEAVKQAEAQVIAAAGLDAVEAGQ